MRIIYISHPIGNDVKGNLEKIAAIYRQITLTYPDVIPFVPYFVTCMALNDADPLERNAGILHNIEVFKTGIINEVWLFGSCISHGMKHEMQMAEDLNILVIDKTNTIIL